MKKTATFFYATLEGLKIIPGVVLVFLVIFFQACDQDDPDPVNEEEVITTLMVTLSPLGGGDAVELKFFDEDGEQGSIAPVTSVSGNLMASTQYTAVIRLANETADPAEDITEEILEEANDHLFCFTTDGDIAVDYEDEDNNGLVLGLVTTWRTGQTGAAAVTISLRHQPETKTGVCPGIGETDLEVTFNVTVE